jgi:hypothetical protein
MGQVVVVLLHSGLYFFCVVVWMSGFARPAAPRPYRAATSGLYIFF